MADFDDMNATPLGKLPMPAVSSRADAPRVEAATSYNDLLKEMNAAKAPPRAPEPAGADFRSFGGAAAQQFQQAPLAPAAPATPAAPPAPPQPQYAPPAYYDKRRPSRRRRYDDQEDLDDYDVPDVRPAKGPWATLRRHKSSVLVAAVTFLVLWYVAPKLAAMVPQLLTPTGKFNVAGLAVVAATIGGVHRVADHYVK